MSWKAAGLIIAVFLSFVAGQGALCGSKPPPQPSQDGTLPVTVSLEMPGTGLAGALMFGMVSDAVIKCQAVRGAVTQCTLPSGEQVAAHGLNRNWQLRGEAAVGKFILTGSSLGPTVNIFLPVAAGGIEDFAVYESASVTASWARVVLLDVNRKWQLDGQALVARFTVTGSPGEHILNLFIPVADDDNGNPVIYESVAVEVVIPESGSES